MFALLLVHFVVVALSAKNYRSCFTQEESREDQRKEEEKALVRKYSVRSVLMHVVVKW